MMDLISISFALSILLGDVFIHLLPEAWHTDSRSITPLHPISLGCNSVVLSGLLIIVSHSLIFITTNNYLSHSCRNLQKHDRIYLV